jgi:peptidoglycan/xylan/chitin deacetylase (PgdA/CDA1 family)
LAHRSLSAPKQFAFHRVFLFDDFPKSAVTNGARLLECQGVTGTFYYCRSLNGRTVDEMDYYNIDDLRRLVSNGHELGCHTASHILASRYSRADILRDIEENATYLREQFGDVRMTTFAFPFGDINLGSKILLQERFAACRTTAPGLNHGSVDPGASKAQRLYSNAINPAGVTRLIKEAAASNAWLIFYTHDVDKQPSKYGCTPGLFEAALETALAEHRDILPGAQRARNDRVPAIGCPSQRTLAKAGCRQSASNSKRSVSRVLPLRRRYFVKLGGRSTMP